MSIILKGIDSPKMGECRRIVIYDNGDVVVNEERWGEDGYKHYKTFYDVEAIQIPKGHGRIGDLEKLAKLLSNFGESLKESARGNKLLMTERDICHAMAVLTEHFQEYEPLLEAEEDEC